MLVFFMLRLASFLRISKILENTKAFMEAVLKAKPAAVKGQYTKKVSLTSRWGGDKNQQNDLSRKLQKGLGRNVNKTERTTVIEELRINSGCKRNLSR